MLSATRDSGVAEIRAARCLNARHAAAGCRRCVDACPTAAVVVHALVPVVEPDRCVDCGACASVCPTDAVALSDLAERRFVDSVNSTVVDRVTVRCGFAPESPVGVDGVVVQHGRCLAALAPDRILALVAGGRTMTLDLSSCESCRIGTSADVVIDTARAVNVWLGVATASDRAAVDVRLEAGAPSAAPPTVVGTVIDSRRPRLSRRGWFSAARRRAATVVERAVQADPAPMRLTHGPASMRLPRELPSSRRRLLDSVDAVVIGSSGARRDRTVDIASVAVAEVQVDSGRCSACGLCATYCPTGALEFVLSSCGDGGTFELSFQAAQCIDCGICAAACPEFAVRFGTRIDEERLLARSWSPVASGILTRCADCGLPTAHRADDDAPRCFSCRLGSGPVSALRDEAGLMRDLLARTDARGDRSAPGADADTGQ